MKRTFTYFGLPIFLSLITLLLINGCKKSDYQKPEEAKATATGKTTYEWSSYNPMHIKFDVGLFDKDDHLVNTIHSNKTAKTLDDFPGCSDHSYLITLAYEGFSTLRTSPNTTYDITHTWTLEVPTPDYNILASSGTWKGYQSFQYTATGTWSAYTGVVYSISSPTYFTVTDPNTSTTVNMARYRISYTYTLSETDFCNNDYYRTYPKIKTDCSEQATIMPLNPSGGVAAYQGAFTPNTYVVYDWGGSNNNSDPNKHQLDVFPLIVTPAPCHQGSLGASPSHIIYYRKQGASTWNSITKSNYTTQTIDVTSTGAGTYEIQSQGKITSTTYSPLSSIKTATVL